ncbi:hypothetical protein [Microbacterium sp.]|uniref:hypothetical protein n=1 Tax=Microbacterium sp. TaxID=51671 RepID=UPI003A956BDF
MLGLELVTDHWFVGFYIFDILLLGAGDPYRLVIIVFLGVLTSMNIGSVFAAAWVHFGARGPQFIGAGLVLVAVLMAMPSFAAIAAAFELWWLAVLAAGMIVLSSTGAWLLLRRAIVR